MVKSSSPLAGQAVIDRDRGPSGGYPAHRRPIPTRKSPAGQAEVLPVQKLADDGSCRQF